MTLADVLVVLAIVFLAVLAVIVSLPRRRETARLAACRNNLMQIGVALSAYDGAEGCLPTVPTLGGGAVPDAGPLRSLMQSETYEPRQPRSLVERRIPGFLCPSDRAEIDPARFPAPVSYRACAGDRPDGKTGGFAPGRRVGLADVESGNGLAYTAAFSERLLGDRSREDTLYRSVQGPIGAGGCPAADPSNGLSDAGRSWAEASWRSTLYHHAMTPGARPSCIAQDGTTAMIGASSGHAAGVNVLIFDGSVRTYTPRIAPTIWKALATTESR